MQHQSVLSSELTRITVLQGEAHVSASADAEMSAVLGSCVATCLYDPEMRVGGMNHFLLAEPPASHSRGEYDVHYGVYLMELLINRMLAQGALKSRMRAHLYGGAKLRPGMMRIGSMNADFARGFLAREGIPLMREDLGGNHARRLDFRPASGKVRCRAVENSLAQDVRPTSRPERATGDVELF
jgi:chemotaxis protein CheD